MILCTISQFSALQPHLGSDLIAEHNITSEEFEFIQLIHDYETRQNDNDLVYIIDSYERIFNNINVTRLVALKLLGYHPQVPLLKFDPTLLESYQAQQRQAQQQVFNKSQNSTNLSAENTNIQIEKIENLDEIDPVLQLVSGNLSA